MHILYVDQYFRTPEEGGGIRSYYLAKGLVDAGHQVTLISGHTGAKYKRVFIDGIHVHYLPLPRRTWIRQVRATLRFVRLACQRTDLFQRADVCYLAATPLQVGLIGWYYRRRFNLPFYTEISELNKIMPRRPASSSSGRSWLRTRLQSQLENQLLRHTKGVVARTPAVEAYLRQAIPQKPVRLLTNIADCRFFSHSERTRYHERQFAVAGKFVVSYMGALDPSYQLTQFMDAAQACQRRQLNDVQFLLVGTGSDRARLQAYAQQAPLDNLRFLPHQNKYGMLSVLNVTDAVYVPSAGQAEGCYADELFFDALASGKLCITNTRGWITELVEENDCGFYASAHHPDEFAAQLIPFVNDHSRLEACQANARALGERQFDRERQVAILLDALGVHSSVPHPEVRADTLPA